MKKGISQMSKCLRCGRELIDQNAKYGWRCAQKVGVPYGNSDSVLKKFPELQKKYDFLSAGSKKKFDEYFDEMEEKNSYVDTAIEGAGMYISLVDELDKAYNEEVERKNDQNHRINNLLKTKVTLDENKKLGELKSLRNGIKPYAMDGIMVAANPLNTGSYNPFNKIKFTLKQIYLEALIKCLGKSLV